MLDVTIGEYRLTYDRNVKYSFYIGGYIIENTTTGIKRCTNVRPSIGSRYNDLLEEVYYLFRTGSAIRE